jgi:N-acyl-D-amino-acid deacylase
MADPEPRSGSELPMQAVLRGAEVIDGTGEPSRRADVAIEGGRIVAVGPNLPFDFPEVDLTGLVLSPGFIDPHTHYDAQVFWDPDFTPSNWHGITTVVTGNCGFTLAPTRPGHRDVIVRTLQNVEGMPLEALQAGVQWSFESFPEYLREVDSLNKRLNMACMIGHTALRWFVLGDDAPDRKASNEEVARMCQLVKEAIGNGAIGFSTSQHTHVGAFGKPVPSRAASAEELLRIATAVGETGTGTIEMVINDAYDIEDVVRIARSAARPLTWSGDRLMPIAGEGRLGEAKASVEATSSEGLSVFPQFACHPIIAQVNLQDPFPLRSVSDGFLDVLAVEADRRMEVYRNEGWRRRTQELISAASLRRLADTTIAESVVHSRLVKGPTLGTLAAEDNTTPFEVLVDLSIAEGLTTRFAIAVANTDQDVITTLLADRRCVIGLGDAGAHITQHCDAQYATILLGEWVRERKALPLELAVWRLTGQPAAIFGLHDRGRIAPGAAADLVAFDATRVGPGAEERVRDFPGDAERVVVHSVGIEYVWVNGTLVRAGGQDRPGVAAGRRLSAPVPVDGR